MYDVFSELEVGWSFAPMICKKNLRFSIFIFEVKQTTLDKYTYSQNQKTDFQKKFSLVWDLKGLKGKVWLAKKK